MQIVVERLIAAAMTQSIPSPTKTRDSAGQGESGFWSPNPPKSLQTLQLFTPHFGKKEEASPWSPEF